MPVIEQAGMRLEYPATGEQAIRANGTIKLDSSTVQNDASAADSLTGGADVDWFFQSSADVLIDFNASLEIITPI